MRCRHCNTQINNNDIYCPKCRKKTQSIKENFLFWRAFKESYQEVKDPKNYNFKFNLFFAFLTFVFISLLIGHYFIIPYNNEWSRYLVENLIFIIFVPLLIVPFGIQNVVMEIGYGKELRKYITKIYPRYLVFVLINTVIFSIFKFLCIGDSVLRLVRVILVLWWLAVILPIPVLLTKYHKSFYKHFKLALKGFEDLRWQLFLAYLIVLGVNILMIIPIFLGYLRFGSLPYNAVNRYVEKIDDNEVLDEYLK